MMGGVRAEVFEKVKEELRMFKETILEVGEEVRGTRRVREGKRRKGSVWWSEEDLNEYKRMKRVVKRMIREAKERVNEEWTKCS